jgi:hypothetical protein
MPVDTMPLLLRHRRRGDLRRTICTSPPGISRKIRKWIGEGFLDVIPGPKPVEVDPRSVVRVERVLENVRESYPSRE